jgi:hypothetical protein
MFMMLRLVTRAVSWHHCDHHHHCQHHCHCHNTKAFFAATVSSESSILSSTNSVPNSPPWHPCPLSLASTPRTCPAYASPTSPTTSSHTPYESPVQKQQNPAHITSTTEQTQPSSPPVARQYQYSLKSIFILLRYAFHGLIIRVENPRSTLPTRQPTTPPLLQPP